MLDNLIRTMPRFLRGAGLFVAGYFVHELIPALPTIVAAIPKSVLLAGLCLSLAGIVTLIILLLRSQRELNALRQQPRWDLFFGLHWRFLPSKKEYEQLPYCVCHPERPYPMRWEGQDGEHRDIFSCSSRGPSWDNKFFLKDDAGEYLTLAKARECLPTKPA